MQDIFAAIQQAWAIVPFPFIFLLLIIAAFLWLWLEHHMTRASRRMPGWRQPVPITSYISAGAVTLIRILRVLLWIWVILFVVLTIVLAARHYEADIPSELSNGVVSVANAWRQGYGWIASVLPDSAPDWLQPAP